jgi:PilZ domain-containing protein
MDDELIDRREAPRLPAELLRMPQATLRPGCPVEVVDLSPRGIQVQSVRPLRPDSRVLARVVVGDQTVTIPAVVLRCSVWAVDPEAVTYRAGLRFEQLCVPIWEELATGARLLHAPP